MGLAGRLLDRARTETGLSDFGAETFREGLDVLTTAIAAEARLTPFGQAAIEAQIVGLLAQRLQIEDWYRRHPEIDDEQIVAPLIGLGLPRTGSTALAHLLGEDPAVRSIRTWESMAPCPPPEIATQATDPRIALAEASMVGRAKVFPRMTAMLPSTATSPTECQQFMAHDFKSQLLCAFLDVPSYSDWLYHRADLVPTYAHVKRVLKLLQWRCGPKRWRLKNPSHSLFIEALDEVFPDARFVMTHRAVAEVIPSSADVYYELRKGYSDQVDLPGIGRETSGSCELGMRRMIAFRDGGQEARFFDIQFAPFQQDPFPILAELYEWLGEELTAETIARMQAWRQSTPRPASYQRTPMAAFGFTSSELQNRFAFYSERFAMPESTHP